MTDNLFRKHTSSLKKVIWLERQLSKDQVLISALFWNESYVCKGRANPEGQGEKDSSWPWQWCSWRANAGSKCLLVERGWAATQVPREGGSAAPGWTQGGLNVEGACVWGSLENERTGSKSDPQVCSSIPPTNVTAPSATPPKNGYLLSRDIITEALDSSQWWWDWMRACKLQPGPSPCLAQWPPGVFCPGEKTRRNWKAPEKEPRCWWMRPSLWKSWLFVLLSQREAHWSVSPTQESSQH